MNTQITTERTEQLHQLQQCDTFRSNLRNDFDMYCEMQSLNF